MTRDISSPAKINWTLEVVGKRPDGFHEIRSLVSPVTLCDELRFDDRPGRGFAIECDRPGIPTDERNLIWRAADLLARTAGRPLQGSCRVRKRIPVGGGLGGGSSNAASTLLALAGLWGLNWPRDRLAALAAEVGSDVPLFFAGGSAVIAGRGEQVTPLDLAWNGWIVLILPGLEVSTAEVYRFWRPACGPVRPPVVPETGGGAIAWMKQTFNMLEAPAMQVCPRLADVVRAATELAGRPVRVSGSGSTCFTAFDEADEARQFAIAVEQQLGLQVQTVRLK